MFTAGDMITIEAMYHDNYQSVLYNRDQQAAPKKNDRAYECLHGVVFAKREPLMEEMHRDVNNTANFKLTNLTQLYIWCSPLLSHYSCRYS